jgi:hypothetical protein
MSRDLYYIGTVVFFVLSLFPVTYSIYGGLSGNPLIFNWDAAFLINIAYVSISIPVFTEVCERVFGAPLPFFGGFDTVDHKIVVLSATPFAAALGAILLASGTAGLEGGAYTYGEGVMVGGVIAFVESAVAYAVNYVR